MDIAVLGLIAEANENRKKMRIKRGAYETFKHISQLN